MSEYKRLDRILVHEGKVIDLYKDVMQLPNGNIVEWDYVHHKGAAAILPIDTDGKIIMVRQYRNGINKYSLEIPAGCLNPGEDMITCVAREVEEEIGYIAGKIEHLFDLHTTVAFCNEKIGIYYTTELTPSKQNLDEDEFVTIERYTLEEAVQRIWSGDIDDSKTMAAILGYKAKMNL